jgi:hypothetical protein
MAEQQHPAGWFARLKRGIPRPDASLPTPFAPRSTTSSPLAPGGAVSSSRTAPPAIDRPPPVVLPPRQSLRDPFALSTPAGPSSVTTRSTMQTQTPAPRPILGAGTQPAGPRPVTREYVVRKYRLRQIRDSQETIALGRLADEWVSHQTNRAEAIQELHDALVADGTVGEAARVSRDIGCYWVSRLLGEETAKTLPVSALRLFLPFLTRNLATQQWELRATHADKVRDVWSRAGAEKLSAAAVRQQILAFRPARKKSERRKRGPLARILKALRALGPTELTDVMAACQEQLAALQEGLAASRAEPESLRAAG